MGLPAGAKPPTPPNQPTVILRCHPAGEDGCIPARVRPHYPSTDHAANPAGKDGRVSARANPPTLPDRHAVILRYHPAGKSPHYPSIDDAVTPAGTAAPAFDAAWRRCPACGKPLRRIQALRPRPGEVVPLVDQVACAMLQCCQSWGNGSGYATYPQGLNSR